MADINQLTSVDTPTAGDLLPIWSSQNGDTRKISLSNLVTFFESQVDTGNGFYTQYSAPATGFILTMSPLVAGTSVFLLVKPAADLAAGTLVLPIIATVSDGQELIFKTTKAITSFAYTGNGATVDSTAPSTLTAGGKFRLRFDLVNSTWYSI